LTPGCVACVDSSADYAAAASLVLGHTGQLDVEQQQQPEQQTGQQQEEQRAQQCEQQQEEQPEQQPEQQQQHPQLQQSHEQQSQEQQQQEQQQNVAAEHIEEDEALPPLTDAVDAAVAAPGLGPAGLALVKPELGPLPSQQQVQYWQLADKPFDGTDLHQLVQHYMMPSQVTVLRDWTTRSGRERPVYKTRPDIVRRHYPQLAESLHELLRQVQQQQPGSGSAAKSTVGKRKRNGGGAAVSFTENAATVVLLRALRCLQLWQSKHPSQGMPAMLQRMAVQGGSGAAAAAAAGSGDHAGVVEVVDLSHDDDNDVDPEQLAAFLAGQVEVLLEKSQQGRQQGSAAAAAVRVKEEPLD
jgi:hypothetical protein